MDGKKPARPVKPLPAERVRPQGVWSLERFSEQARKEAQALDEQVLAQMRTELQPRLDEEIARLKAEAAAEAREAGYQAGYAAGERAGYEAGYQAGMEAAQAEIGQLKADVSAWIKALEQPLQAWDTHVSTLVADIIRETLLRFLVEDAQARTRLIMQQLEAVLGQMRQVSAPVTVRAHPDLLARLQALGDDQVQWQPDEQLPQTEVHVHQASSEVVVDWRSLLEHYLETLHQQLSCGQSDNASSDPTAEKQA